MIGSLHEHVAIKLMGIRVVILVIAIREVFLTDDRVSSIGDVTEVIAIEILQRKTTDDVPRVILIVHIPDEAIGVLRQSLLSYKIGLLDIVAVGIGSRHTKF